MLTSFGEGVYGGVGESLPAVSLMACRLMRPHGQRGVEQQMCIRDSDRGMPFVQRIALQDERNRRDKLSSIWLLLSLIHIYSP